MRQDSTTQPLTLVLARNDHLGNRPAGTKESERPLRNDAVAVANTNDDCRIVQDPPIARYVLPSDLGGKTNIPGDVGM